MDLYSYRCTSRFVHPSYNVLRSKTRYLTSKTDNLAYENRNRGPQTSDESNFGPKASLALRKAADDYGFLQERGYGKQATTKIVGDRYRLNTRQRTALQRIAASSTEIAHRQALALGLQQLKGQKIAIDGFNLLITLESALSGGFVFRCRDGAFRDMASISGSYKRVRQTQRAIELVASTLLPIQPQSITWYLDQPVSNSGKLATLIREIGTKQEINWEVALDPDPDGVIIGTRDAVAISSDSRVMDESYRWSNLTASIVAQLTDIRLVDLARSS